MSRIMTMVFEIEDDAARPNPFNVATPFGFPVAIARGNLLSKNDILIEALEEIEQENMGKDVGDRAAQALDAFHRE